VVCCFKLSIVAPAAGEATLLSAVPPFAKRLGIVDGSGADIGEVCGAEAGAGVESHSSESG